MAVIVLIGGGSSSGKTTIARELESELSSFRVLRLSFDNYYHDLSSLSEEELSDYNFDHPDALDWQRLLADLQGITLGERLSLPLYNFITHSREQGEELKEPVDIVILEGIFALYFEELKEMAELRIFVETDSDIRLIRRIRRDIRERGFTLEEVLAQYEKVVKPMFEHYIEPTRRESDIILQGTKLFARPVKMIQGYVLNKLIDAIYEERGRGA